MRNILLQKSLCASPPHILVMVISFKKNIFFVMFYYLTKCHCLVAFTSWDIEQTFAFSSSRFSASPKSHDKNLNISRTKRAFKMRQKVFFIIFKGLSLKQIKTIFLKDESPTLRVLKLLRTKYEKWKIDLPILGEFIINILKLETMVIYQEEVFFSFLFQFVHNW